MFPDFSSPYRLEPPNIYDRRVPMSPYTPPSYPTHTPSLGGGPTRSPPLPPHHNYQHSTSPWYNASAIDHTNHSLTAMSSQRHSPPYNSVGGGGAYSYQDPIRNNYLTTCQQQQQQTVTSSPHQLTGNRETDLVSPISLSPRTPTHTFSPPGGTFPQHM